MKKIYFLSLFCCLSIVLSAQTTTTIIYCKNGATYWSGNCSSTGGRTSGNLKSGGTATGTQYRGYAEFNLDSIPVGTTLSSCVIGFNVSGYAGTGTPGTTTTYGYVGDLKAVTTGATLFTDCIAGTVLSTGSYGTATGNQTLATTIALQDFMATNAGDTAISICWTGGSPRTYTISGYTNAATLTGTHRPYIQVQYCTGVTSVTATVSPGTVCQGSALTLTGGGSGTTSYLWTGPGSYSSTLQSPVLTAAATSAGVYTFTAYNAGGCATSVITTSVTVNPLPLAITGTAAVCLGTNATLSESLAGGTWSSGTPAVASIDAFGNVTSIGAGTTVISNTNGCGAATVTFTVNPNPSPITGSYSVCQGATTGLSTISTGGSWSSTPLSVATVDAFGNVGGISAGSATIIYAYPTTCYVTAPMTVDPYPTAITGTPSECAGATTTLADVIPGGAWSSSNNGVASIDATGDVTGIISSGSVTISYTNNCGTATVTNNVLQSPVAITGRDSVCALAGSVLSDGVPGGTWSSFYTSVATVPSTVSSSETITGIAAGSTTISYTLLSGCYVTTPFTVVGLPAPISGPNATCPNATISLTDDTLGGHWTIDDVAVATVSNTGVVTGLFADTVTVNYTLPIGCSVSKQILVNPLPAPITGTGTFCPSSPITLADDSLGGIWSSGSPSIATINPTTGLVTGLSGGTANITYTLPTGCIATTSEVVHSSPSPVITYNWAAGAFSVSATYASYQWYDGASATDTTPINGAVSYNLAAVYNQYYFVVVTDSFGCISESAPYDMTKVGVSNVTNSNDITIYPNPASDILYITSAVRLQAIISDMEGKTVLEQADAKEMDIHNLPAGVYMIALYNDNGKRLLVQKLVKRQ